MLRPAHTIMLTCVRSCAVACWSDYPNLEVVIIDDSDVPVVGLGATPTPVVNQGAAAATPDVTAAAVAAPLDAAQATRARHAGSSATYRVSRELLALQGKLLGDAATPEQAAAAEASRSAPPGAVRTYRYFHFAAQMSIGEKRNQAAARASGDIVITWDDDDLFRPHRISRQVREPRVSRVHLLVDTAQAQTHLVLVMNRVVTAT